MMKKVMLLMLVTGMLGGFASAVTWENDMSTDPVGDGWAVRGTANNYTIGGGLLTMPGTSAYDALLDQTPDDPFFGTTTIDLEWRATSGTSANGIGLWFNVGCEDNDPDNPDQVDADGLYSYLRFFSNVTGSGQTFTINGAGTTPTVTHTFGAGMLDLHVVIEYDNAAEPDPIRKLTYTITDGTITESGTIDFGEQAVGGATKGIATMYDSGTTGEFDYIKIDNQPEGAVLGAHSPDPAGPVVSSTDVPAYAASGVSWEAPLTQADPNGDPNLVSVDSYDVWWSVGAEPNYVTDTPTNQTATSYLPAPPITYDTTYFWRVDTYINWDSNEITGNFTDKIEGSTWSFTTEPAYTPPIISTYNNVMTTLDIGAGNLSATITNNTDAITSVVWTLLTDDIEFPAGSDAAVVDTTTDMQNPTATLTTTVAGTYKVKLVASDGTGKEGSTQEAVAEVDVYADACEAKKASPSGWTANYYDRDDDCDVDVVDLGVLAAAWLDSTELAEPATVENLLVGYTPADVFENRIETEWAALGPISRTGSETDLQGWITDADPNMYGDDPNSCSDWPLYDRTGAPQIRLVSGTAYDDNVSKCRFSNSRTGGFWADYKIDVQTAGVPVDIYANYAVPDDTRVVRFSSAVMPPDDSTFDAIIVGADLYGEINLASTGGGNNYYSNAHGTKIGTVTFQSTGVQRVRMSWSAWVNFDWISFDWPE